MVALDSSISGECHQQHKLRALKLILSSYCITYHKFGPWLCLQCWPKWPLSRSGANYIPVASQKKNISSFSLILQPGLHNLCGIAGFRMSYSGSRRDRVCRFWIAGRECVSETHFSQGVRVSSLILRFSDLPLIEWFLCGKDLKGWLWWWASAMLRQCWAVQSAEWLQILL